MQVIKTAGRIMGANLSSTERKAMMMEIRKELAEWDRKNLLEIDAVILWELHAQFGFGPERLKKFYMAFSDAIHDLANRYEMDDNDEDRIWICQKRLKDLGVDPETWAKEKGLHHE